MREKRILMMAPFPPPIGGQAIISKIVEDEIRPKKVINLNTIGKSKILINVKIFIQIISIIFTKYDLVYFTCSRSVSGSLKDFFLLFVLKFKKCKVVNHLHGNEWLELKKNVISNFLVNALYPRIDEMIFVSNYQKELFPKDLVKKCTVINNCYSNIFQIQDNRKRRGKNQPINMIYPSNIIFSKGIFDAMESFEILAKKGINIQLNIVGTFAGDDYLNESEVKSKFFDKLNELQNKGLEINYLGVQSQNNLKDLYLSSDLCVFPSFYKTESFGLVIVEAMAMGAVVIARKIPFIEEVTDGSCYVYDPSVTSLHESILKLVNDEQLFYSLREKGYKNAERFTEKRFRSKINTL